MSEISTFYSQTTLSPHLLVIQSSKQGLEAGAGLEANTGAFDGLFGHFLFRASAFAFQCQIKRTQGVQVDLTAVHELHLDHFNKGANGSHHFSVIEIGDLGDQVGQLFKRNLIAPLDACVVLIQLFFFTGDKSLSCFKPRFVDRTLL